MRDTIVTNTRQLVWAALGVKHNWDRWELIVDHNKKFPLHELIKEQAKKEAPAFIRENAKDYKTLSKKDKASLAKAFHEAYLDKLYENIRHEAQMKAEEDSAKIVKAIAKIPVPVQALLKELKAGKGLRHTDEGDFE